MSITIKATYLDRVACQDQVALFRRTFGEEVEVTADVVRLAAEAGLDVGWAASRFLSPLLRADYCAKVDPLRAEYSAKEDPLRAEYRAKVDSLQDEYQAKAVSLWDEYHAKIVQLIIQLVEQEEGGRALKKGGSRDEK